MKVRTTREGRSSIRRHRARAAPQARFELCTEILSLVEMLTGDTAVAKAFMGEELCVVDWRACYLSVVRQFTGKRSLDIKISNPDAYGFDPKDILS